jgi:hypothetical protein
MSRDYIDLNRMKQAPHPPIRQIWHPRTFPFSFFPFPFSLFGYVKGKLMRFRAETPSELLVRIRVILAEIPQENLNAVFLEWMDGAIAKMHANRW